MKKIGEIKDPVHGYIYFTEVEKRVIDSRPVQRLRGIKQLAGAELTYPGAIHTRFLHSLGVMHLSGLHGSHLVERGYISEEEVQKVRLAGLLHDVGHGPFSHVYEEPLNKYRNLTHEDLAGWVISESEVGDILTQNGFSKEEVSQLATGRLANKEKGYLNQIIAGHFSSDIIDYLVRDSYFAGVEYGRVDVQRLISSLDLVGNQLVADYSDALGVLESFLIARIEMFNVVYFHRTVRAANVMISRAMDFANEKLGLCSFDSIEDFLELDDAKVTQDLLSLKESREEKPLKAYEFISKVAGRQLLKSTYELTLYRKDDFFEKLLNKTKIRRQLEVEIGEKADVDPDYVIIDVPQVLSVPINPIERRRSEILVFKRAPTGGSIQKITELSPILAALTEFIDIIRVYTLPKYRENVASVCEKLFGQRSYSTSISI